MARVVLEHVGRVYPNGFEAICDFNLDVADGELLVLVGPSGCGKTTTLRMIAGLEQVTRGTITIGSKVVNDVPPKNRDVAMVFQSHALYPHMTARRNMAFSLKLRKTPRAERDRAVRRAAEMLDIGHLLERKPGQLSGGERQRVALGRAIVRRAACFLFDEPLSSLDARLRVEMRSELKRLHRQLQTTTIHVTHDQEEALALGDRVAIVREGRLQQIGTPREVYRHPANRFVAGFLGSAPMNFLEGTITEHDGRLWFDEGDRRLAVPDWAVEDLSGKVGVKVVLGVRPEVLRLRPIEGQRPPCQNTLDVTVDRVESLGDKIDVHLSAANHPPLTARLDGRKGVRNLLPERPEGCFAQKVPGTFSRLRIYVDLDRVHFFEPDDERTGRPGANLCLAAETKRDGSLLS